MSTGKRRPKSRKPGGKRKPAPVRTRAHLQSDGALVLPMARIEITHSESKAGLDHVIYDPSALWIDLSVVNRAADTRGNYRQRWHKHRFERVGPLFIVPPGERLHLKSAEPTHASAVCRLNVEALEACVEQKLDWSERRLEASLDVANADIRRLMRKLAHERHHPGLAFEAMAELLTQELAIEVVRFFTAVDAPAAVGGLAPWRLQLIDERVSEARETPSLSELAALCNMSARQLARAFRISRGASIGNYILQTRIDTAKRLLANDVSVTAIAEQLGYASLASFSFAFRRGAGVSPRQYRTRTLRRA